MHPSSHKALTGYAYSRRLSNDNIFSSQRRMSIGSSNDRRLSYDSRRMSFDARRIQFDGSEGSVNSMDSITSDDLYNEDIDTDDEDPGSSLITLQNELAALRVSSERVIRESWEKVERLHQECAANAERLEGLQEELQRTLMKEKELERKLEMKTEEAQKSEQEDGEDSNEKHLDSSTNLCNTSSSALVSLPSNGDGKVDDNDYYDGEAYEEKSESPPHQPSPSTSGHSNPLGRWFSIEKRNEPTMDDDYDDDDDDSQYEISNDATDDLEKIKDLEAKLSSRDETIAQLQQAIDATIKIFKL